MPWLITLRVTDEHGRKLKDLATEGMLRPGVNGLLNEAVKVLGSQAEPLRHGVKISIMATYQRVQRYEVLDITRTNYGACPRCNAVPGTCVHTTKRKRRNG